MIGQLVDKTEQTLRHFRVIGIADEHRIASPDGNETLGRADAALAVIATDHDVVVATLFGRTPHHHWHAELVVETHGILAHTLAQQDQAIGRLHRRIRRALPGGQQHAVSGRSQFLRNTAEQG